MSLTDDVASLTGTTYNRWNIEAPLGTPTFVTYAFSTSAASYDKGFVAIGETQKAGIRAALGVWEASSGIKFLEVPAAAGGEIRFGFADLSDMPNAVGAPSTGYGYFPRIVTSTFGGVQTKSTTSLDQGGDVRLNAATFAADATSLAPGGRGFSIALHEIGHAIGFKHPFEGTPAIETGHDSSAYTVLSYNRPNSTVALGSVDVAAVQLYYGAAPATYSWDPTALKLAVSGTANADALIGTEFGDSLNGGDGNDLLIGKSGSDSINGGAGTDTASFRGPVANYTVTRTGQTTTVSDNVVNRDGTDTLASVERLKFADTVKAFDTGPDGAAGQGYRLYQAAFNRKPDKDGLSYWIKDLDGGDSLANVAAAFVSSAEFKAVYGSSPTNSQIVDKFYHNVLGRAGEAGGVTYWTGTLDRGVSVGEVLAGFAQSSENQTLTTPAITGGIDLSLSFFT